MPSAADKFHRLPVDLTAEEWARLSAESYSREISRSEMIRRALAHFFECQDSRIEEICKPPKGWRMPRPTLSM